MKNNFLAPVTKQLSELPHLPCISRETLSQSPLRFRESFSGLHGILSFMLNVTAMPAGSPGAMMARRFVNHLSAAAQGNEDLFSNSFSLQYGRLEVLQSSVKIEIPSRPQDPPAPAPINGSDRKSVV